MKGQDFFCNPVYVSPVIHVCNLGVRSSVCYTSPQMSLENDDFSEEEDL